MNRDDTGMRKGQWVYIYILIFTHIYTYIYIYIHVYIYIFTFIDMSGGFYPSAMVQSSLACPCEVAAA